MSKQEFSKKAKASRFSITLLDDLKPKRAQRLFADMLTSGHALLRPKRGKYSINTGFYVIDSPKPRSLTQEDLKKIYPDERTSKVFICGENVTPEGEFDNISLYDSKTNILHRSIFFHASCYEGLNDIIIDCDGNIDLVTPFFNDDLYRFCQILDNVSSNKAFDLCVNKQAEIIAQTHAPEEIERFIKNARYDMQRAVDVSGFKKAYSYAFINISAMLKDRLDKLQSYSLKIKSWSP